MAERIDKIKNHIRKHKTQYLVAGGVVIGAVVGGTIVYFRCKVDPSITEAPINASIGDVNIGGDLNSPLIEIIRNNYAQRGGHPGKKIYIPELGITCRSLSQAASMTGKTREAIRACMNGVRDSVDGMTFHHIGDADAPFA